MPKQDLFAKRFASSRRLALSAGLVGFAAFLAAVSSWHSESVATGPATAQAVGAPPQVELRNTFVHTVPSRADGRRYQIWVDVPATYSESDRRYPVVFVTDANLWFPVVRGLGRLVGQQGQNVEDFILVGLSYEDGLSPAQSRARDYTPSNPRLRQGADLGEYRSDHYGEANAYLHYIEHEVFPFISANYRAEMDRKVYLGHSYGGLFGAFVLATKPELFQTYLLGSPSLWFDDKSIFQLARASVDRSPDLQRRVMMVAGGYETIRPEPRYYKTVDIVADMQSFTALLRSKWGGAGLTVVTMVMPDEDHLTVFPSLISRGLVWALPGRGPYVSG